MTKPLSASGSQWYNSMRVKPNTHCRRRRDATVELSRVGVGNVYWASDGIAAASTDTRTPDTPSCYLCRLNSTSRHRRCQLRFRFACFALPWKRILDQTTSSAGAAMSRQLIEAKRGQNVSWFNNNQCLRLLTHLASIMGLRSDHK